MNLSKKSYRKSLLKARWYRLYVESSAAGLYIRSNIRTQGMTTLLTGATGFVGAAVLRTLIAAGHNVRALVRPNSDRRNLSGVDCEIVTGDLTEPESLKRAVRGCETVFHVAADYRIWVPDREKMNRVNVEGTVELNRAATAAGVSRIVYTSSVATLRMRDD